MEQSALKRRADAAIRRAGTLSARSVVVVERSQRLRHKSEMLVQLSRVLRVTLRPRD